MDEPRRRGEELAISRAGQAIGCGRKEEERERPKENSQEKGKNRRREKKEAGQARKGIMGFVMASKEERSCGQGGGPFRSRYSAPRWELPNVARAIVAGGWRCVVPGLGEGISAHRGVDGRPVLGLGGRDWECGRCGNVEPGMAELFEGG